MTQRSHCSLDGTWETCTGDEACALGLHVDLSVEEIQQLPGPMLELLAHAFDPPGKHGQTPDKQRWFDRSSRLHRDYGLPAVIGTSGTRQWYRHGKRHRDGDLPAVVRADKAITWWRDGLQHRDDGKPAVIYPSGKVEYWVHGVRLMEPEGDVPTGG